MIESIYKLTALFKISYFSLFFLTGTIRGSSFKEINKYEDPVPGDNFPHVFLRRNRELEG